jgi:hypothetical protein
MADLDVQTVRLKRNDTGTPWGFRLQGGRDFNTPLSVQKVTEKSIAKRSGLKEGDAILSIGKTKTDTFNHEEAKMEIIRNGNELEFLVQRGAVKIWQPEVTPISSLRPKQPNLSAPTGESPPPAQKTSLHANKQEYVPIGVAHNRAPQAFAPTASVILPENKQVIQQVNSPASLYSAENAAQAFTSQMEAQGLEAHLEGVALDEKPAMQHRPSLYGEDDENHPTVQSRSFLMLQQSLDESEGTPNLPASRWSKEGGVNAPNPELACPEGVTPIKPVKPPTEKPATEKAPQQHMTCYVCGGLCTGVFVKIHGQPIHPDCFRCKVCKMNLKQKGYFWINDNMFCETHAKEVAQPPAPGMIPVVLN